jgi:hypothetical protein
MENRKGSLAAVSRSKQAIPASISGSKSTLQNVYHSG